MQSRLESLSALGIPTEFHSYNGLPHGFGLGLGTVAEGWLIDAVRFWQQQSGANDIRSAKANTRQQNSIYSLNGTRRNAIQKGINIVDGKRSRFSERNVSLFTFPNVSELERSSKFIQQ